MGSTTMLFWSGCWAPSEMGLCGVSLIWCGFCLGPPAVGFTRLLCVWPASESLPLTLFPKKDVVCRRQGYYPVCSLPIAHTAQ